MALDVFEKKYRMYDKDTKNASNVLTTLQWASAELQARNIEEAALRLDSAERLVRDLPEGTHTQVFKGQLIQLKNRLLAPAQATSTNPIPVTNSDQIPALAPQTGMPQLPLSASR
jgi:hypothetical protein